MYITGISKGLTESKSSVCNLKLKTIQKLTQDPEKTNGKQRKNKRGTANCYKAINTDKEFIL